VIFAPPPLPSDRVDLNRAAKKKARWETIAFWWFLSSSVHLFSIKLLFLGKPMIDDISAHCPVVRVTPSLT
jgi:heme/copper-type cytochrome/quinol oxidase subunit 3